jgi:peroxidase
MRTLAAVVSVALCLSLFVAPALANNGYDTLPAWEKRVDGLDAGYYSKSCPDMEAVVQKAVRRNVDKDYTLAPSLIRLFFHDFAVQVPCRAMRAK